MGMLSQLSHLFQPLLKKTAIFVCNEDTNSSSSELGKRMATENKHFK